MQIDRYLLKQLCKIQSPSRSEYKMISFIINYCMKIPNIKFELDHYNNLFITKNTNNPDSYVCILAHMDSIVTNKGPYKIKIKDGIISGYNICDNSPCSLGLDDKVGICIALQLLHRFPDLKIVFTTEEEMGAIGALEASDNIDFLSNVRYFLQADRMGNSDFITHTNGIDVSSKEFIDDTLTLMNKYQYEPSYGTLTDVGEFCEKLSISGCNLSCGYYHQHTTKEYGVFKHMSNCLKLMRDIILTLPNDKIYSLEKQSDYEFLWEPCTYVNSSSINNKDDEMPCNHCINFDCKNCSYLC